MSHEQLSLDTLDAIGDYEAAARAFLRDYPEAYGLIVKWARRDMAEGNRPAMHGYLWLLRRTPWVHPGSRIYEVSNNWSRPLVDIVCADYPELADPKRGFERRDRGRPRKDAAPRAGDAAA